MSKVYTSNKPQGQGHEADGANWLSQREPFVRRMLVTVGMVTAVVLLLVFLWAASRVLLIVFAGILLAVVLRALSDLLSKYTSIRPGWSLTIVVLVIVGLLGLGGWSLAPQVAEQVDQLTQTLPEVVQELRQQVEEYEWLQQILPQMQAPDGMQGNQGEMMTQAAGFFSTTLTVLVEVVIVLFIGLYFAANPDLYKHGVVRLVPISKRDRAQEVLDRLGYTLRWWLLGRLAAMFGVAVVATLGLWLLDVPLALMFGLLTFLLTFVPYIGAIASTVLPTLAALLESPTLALYVLLLYLVVQNVEGYVFTPLIQQRVVSLPPALTIIAQFLFGVLFGVLGVALATPFAAVAVVLVKMLYIEDVLGDPITESDEKSGEEDEQAADTPATERETDRHVSKEEKHGARA